MDNFNKHDPAYPGMIGLIAAVTATDCKCSRCERLRGYLPEGLVTQDLKDKTYEMYEKRATNRLMGKKQYYLNKKQTK